MRIGGSNSKGASFERGICVRFSLWITAGKKRDCFWRTAMSGGRATVAFARGGERLDRQAGDICAISPEGHILTDRFFFECKHRRDIQLIAFALYNKGPLANWWKDTCQKAKQHGLEPVVIAKSNRVAPVILTRPGSPLNRDPVAEFKGCSLGLLTRTFRTKFTEELIRGTNPTQEAEQQHRDHWIQPRKPRARD